MKYRLIWMMIAMGIIISGCSNTFRKEYDTRDNDYNVSPMDITIDPAPSPVDPAIPGKPETRPKPTKFG